jgi:hypothetical protein
MAEHTIRHTAWLYPPTWAGFLYGLWQGRQILWISHGTQLWSWTKDLLLLLAICSMILGALGIALQSVYTILTFTP